MTPIPVMAECPEMHQWWNFWTYDGDMSGM